MKFLSLEFKAPFDCLRHSFEIRGPRLSEAKVLFSSFLMHVIAIVIKLDSFLFRLVMDVYHA